MRLSLFAILLNCICASTSSFAADAVPSVTFPDPEELASASNLGFKVYAHFPATYSCAATANEKRGLVAFARCQAGPTLLAAGDDHRLVSLSAPMDKGWDNAGSSDLVFSADGAWLYSGNVCRHVDIGCSAVNIVDVRDPSNPKLAAAFGSRGASAIALRNDERAIFLGLESGELIALDIGNPRKPRVAWTMSFKHSIRSLYASKSERYVFLTTFEDGLYVIDTSGARGGRVVSHAPFIETESVVVSSDDTLAFVGTHAEVFAIDLSNPLRPRRIGTYKTDVVSGGSLYLRGEDRHLYLMTPDRGLVLLDVSIPRTIKEMGVLGVPNPEQTGRYFVSTDEQFLYIPTVVYEGQDIEHVGGLTIYQRLATERDAVRK